MQKAPLIHPQFTLNPQLVHEVASGLHTLHIAAFLAGPPKSSGGFSCPRTPASIQESPATAATPTSRRGSTFSRGWTHRRGTAARRLIRHLQDHDRNKISPGHLTGFPLFLSGFFHSGHAGHAGHAGRTSGTPPGRHNVAPPSPRPQISWPGRPGVAQGDRLRSKRGQSNLTKDCQPAVPTSVAKLARRGLHARQVRRCHHRGRHL